MQDERAAGSDAPDRESFVVVAGRLSRILGACDLESLDAAVEECLEQLGRYAGVDVAFVVLADAEERVADDWRWVGIDRALQAPEPGSLLRDTFGSVTEILRLGHTVAVDDLVEIDLAPSERALATANGLRAIVMAPVRVGTTMLGLIGLQVLDVPFHWDRAMIGQVELVAELLVKAVVRTRDRGALAAADARARRIAEFLPDGLLLLDPAGLVTFASPSFARASQLRASELVASPFVDVVHPDDRDLLSMTLGGNGVGSDLVVRIRAGDDWCWSALSWQLVHEPDSGVPDEIVVSVRDVHDKHLEIENLARAHERDPLTGLLDRRGLERAIATLSAQGATISIGFVDFDRFKAVNDGLGHDAGDSVLRLVGGALASAVRRDDIVARIGGDEFCVVARADGEWREGPASLGDRLLSSIEASLATQSDSMTVSIGIAGPGPATTAEALRAGADAAMYRAKRAGGGRYLVADEAAVR